jgi:hypothetical protein
MQQRRSSQNTLVRENFIVDEEDIHVVVPKAMVLCMSGVVLNGIR